MMPARIRKRRHTAERALAQSGQCYLCGRPLIMGKPHTQYLWRRTIDHVVPVSRGGKDKPANQLVAHHVCNNRKGNRMPWACEMLFLGITNMIMGRPWGVSF